MHTPDDEDLIRSAVKQMFDIVADLITSSFGGSNYDRAIEMLGLVRGEMVDFEWSEMYNPLIRGFKGRLVGEEMGGDRRDFWWLVRSGRLGLIDGEESEGSGVGREEATRFLSLKG